MRLLQRAYTTVGFFQNHGRKYIALLCRKLGGRTHEFERTRDFLTWCVVMVGGGGAEEGNLETDESALLSKLEGSKTRN